MATIHGETGGEYNISRTASIIQHILYNILTSVSDRVISTWVRVNFIGSPIICISRGIFNHLDLDVTLLIGRDHDLDQSEASYLGQSVHDHFSHSQNASHYS